MIRREFLKHSGVVTAGIFAIPTFIPSSVFAKYRPNDKINIAQIGCGRIARAMDLPGVLAHDMCRVVAVADLDINRAKDGKKLVEDFYAKQQGKDGYIDVKVYQDYRELLRDDSIDAITISTPDHWHVLPAISAALAGKDVYVQKPLSLTIAEGRTLSDIFNRTGRIFQLGSQMRSVSPWPHYRKGCELVRNGAVGKIKHVEVGMPADPSGETWPEMPVPANLNYDMWLGSTPEIFYTENRVHPQKGYGRPGWLRVEQFGAGMITGWGAHLVDLAHWGMGTEFTGPVEIEAIAEFPASGMWNVHGPYDVHSKYADGATMHISDKLPVGVKFIGEDGWLFIRRGEGKVTASDPSNGQVGNQLLEASNPDVLNIKVGPNGIHLYESPDIHLDWLQCIRSRRQAATTPEQAHRSCSACLLSHIAMKLRRKLYWNPNKEQFISDTEANAMISRTQRSPYKTTDF